MVEKELKLGREESVVLVEFTKSPFVRLLKSDGKCDEELKMPVDSTGNADVLLKGVDVSVLADADKECEVDAVVDDAPSIKLGIGRERDTLGSTSPEAVTPAETTGDGVAGSKGTVETPVTTPAESI